MASLYSQCSDAQSNIKMCSVIVPRGEQEAAAAVLDLYGAAREALPDAR